jgi:hypothetical protein
MINFRRGVHIIKGCNLKIAHGTTMAEVEQKAAAYILESSVINGYKHVKLICNTGLNFESENYLWLCSHGDGEIFSIQIHSIQHNILKPEERAKIAVNCRKWLLKHGQISLNAIYNWGRIGYVEDIDWHYFVGIGITFRCSETKQLFEQLEKMK